MNNKRKQYRELAKLSVISHLTSALLSVVFSSLIMSLIFSFYLNSAADRNVDIFTGDEETLKITMIVWTLSLLVNIPLQFCAMRFYLVISRKGLAQRATMGEFFAPFTDFSLFIKGSAVFILLTLLTALGFAILSLPIYFTYCMSVFVISDNPQLSVFQALRTARRTVKGHKLTVFITVLPLVLIYFVTSILLSSLPIFGFLVPSVIQAIIFTVYAVIYNDIKQ